MALSKELTRLFPPAYLDFLQKLFSQCPNHILAAIRPVKYPVGHPLVTTDETCSYVYILLKGRLQATEEKAAEIPYRFTELVPVDIVGDYELFTEAGGRYITLTTLEPSLCLVLPCGSYLDWIKHDANALFLRTQMLMKQLYTQSQQERRTLFLDNRSRLIFYLLHECESRKHRPAPWIIKSTRDEISGHIGCSVRTLNRIILALHTEGLITPVHGKIQISQEQYQQLKDLR